MAAGNASLIKALFGVKSNLDSGVAQAVQEMAIKALSNPEKEIESRNLRYQARRDRLIPALQALGLGVEPPKASLYIWASVPAGYTSAGFATRLLDEKDIVVTPGSSYGKFGEGYIRLSLTLSDEDVEEAVRRLQLWDIS